MNFVAHIAVGLQSVDGEADELFLTGTALPDFASMARFRLVASPGQLGRGIAVHHASDHAFHGSAWFLDVERELRLSLVRAGLPDGGARACAHVGPELLLDGVLVTDHEVATAVDAVYRRIADGDPLIVGAVVEQDQPGWSRHLARVASTLDPHLYIEVSAVARLLWRIAGRRPRLTFDARHVPAIATALCDVQPVVERVAVEVVEDVASAARRAGVTM